ncbi:MAG: SRPBCC family protein [Ignavibacteria bacterium]|nr:SRPBCC family protein [Ignavibacteria bacterium]
MSALRTLSREISVKRPIEEVFDFFAKAENLNIITPPELNFKILTPSPIEMKQGTLIDYRIKLSGVPFKWKTEITNWEPPFRFVDTQLKGPYKIWIHEHTFSSHLNTTIIKDEVTYLPPGWIMEPVIHKLTVKKKLERIFDYRTEKIRSIFSK